MCDWLVGTASCDYHVIIMGLACDYHVTSV
jgi:hypothetical protein